MSDAGFVEFEEGVEPPSPTSGYDRLYVDESDGKLKKKSASGVVTTFANSNVDSVFGRVGAVVAVAGDYTASEIDNVPAGTITSTDVQAAINQLDTTKAPFSHVGSTGVSQHGIATGVDAGFLSPTDKTKLDGIATGATNTPLSGSTPQPVGTASPGAATDASKSDHVHAHGVQAGGPLHAQVTTSTDGFMIAADKTKLNGVAAGATANSTDAFLLNRANQTGTQPLSTISDVTVTASQVNAIQSGADYPGHFHSSDRARANHTGTQTASTISDFTTAAQTAAVENAINSGTTNKAPAEAAVFTALASKEATANKGASSGYAGLTAESVVGPDNNIISAPQKYSILMDDFISDGGGTTAAGTLSWDITKSGTGSVAAGGGYADVFNLSQGMCSLETGTVATGRICINLSPASIGFGYGTVAVAARAILPVLSTSTDEFISLFGFGDNFGAGTTNTNGISFVYDRTTSVNWICRTTAAGVQTSTITSVPVVAAAFLKLEILVNAAGTSVDFKINGTVVATNTTNIPGFIQEVTPYFKILKSAGTTSRIFAVDYWTQKITWSATR